MLSILLEAEIVLIDHGLYEYIKDADRKNLCKLWKNIILKNDEKMKLYSRLLNVDGKKLITFCFVCLLLIRFIPVWKKLKTKKFIGIYDREALYALGNVAHDEAVAQASARCVYIW